MTFTEKIKNYIINDCRMDSVGVAPASAFDFEAPEHQPESLLPGAKSVIVFTKSIPDGVVQAAFRYSEDKNLDAQSIYASYGVDLFPNMNLFFMQFNISEYIERVFGYTAVPVPSGPMHNVTPVNTKLPAFVGSKRNIYIIHSERAAFAAGLGEIGWNNMLLTPAHGPRQRIGIIVTSMELDYDKPYDGAKLCDPAKCGICSALCPTKAIPAPGGESEKFDIAGKAVEIAKINSNACAVASMAFRKEFTGKAPAEDLVSSCNPSDEELADAYAKKPICDWGLDHYPKHFCNNCMLYCPLGGWKQRFGDRGLSRFNGKELVK